MENEQEYLCKHSKICKHYEESEEELEYEGIIARIVDHASILYNMGIFSTKILMNLETSTIVYAELTGISDGNAYEIGVITVAEGDIPVVISEAVPTGDFILVGMQTGFRNLGLD